MTDGLDARIMAMNPSGGFDYIYEVFNCAINKEFGSLVQFSENFVFRITPVMKVDNIEGANCQTDEGSGRGNKMLQGIQSRCAYKIPGLGG